MYSVRLDEPEQNSEIRQANINLRINIAVKTYRFGLTEDEALAEESERIMSKIRKALLTEDVDVEEISVEYE